MWPGQQPDGDPQQGNPYQRQNPYAQQPGHGQQSPQGHTPYPQPGPYWNGATLPPVPSKPPSGGNSSRAAAVAVVAATAVVATAVLTGYFVLRGADTGGAQHEAGGQGNSGGTAASRSPDATASDRQEDKGSGNEGGGARDPGAGSSPDDDADPPVVTGWQSVTNPRRHSVFDVPQGKDWKVDSPGMLTGYEDDKGKPVATMTAPAYFKKDWCGDTSRAMTGTTGADGAKGTADAAKTTAAAFALGGYDQHQKGKLQESGAKSFKNNHGIHGHFAVAAVTGAPRQKCSSTAGKVLTVSWKNSAGKYVAWVFVTDARVPDQVPDKTINRIAMTLRPDDSDSRQR